MNRQKARQLGKEVVDLVKPLAKQLNCEVRLGNIRFDSAEARIMVILVDKEEQASQFADYARIYELKASDFGKTFNSLGREFRIERIEPNKRKYPIIAKGCSDGKLYKFTAEHVKLMLAASKKSRKK